MTLIIRTPDVLTDPRPGAVVLPDLGVEGIVARLHARSAAVAPGQPVTQVADSSGNGNDFVATEAGVVVGTRSGVTVLDMSTTAGRMATTTNLGLPKARTLAVLAYVAPPATTGTYQFMRGNNSGSNALAISVMAGDTPRLAMYGGSGSYPRTLGEVTPGFHVMMAVMATGGTGTVVLDAEARTGAFTYDNPADGPGNIGLAGIGLEVVDAVWIDHALDAEEITDLTDAFTAQIP